MKLWNEGLLNLVDVANVNGRKHDVRQRCSCRMNTEKYICLWNLGRNWYRYRYLLTSVIENISFGVSFDQNFGRGCELRDRKKKKFQPLKSVFKLRKYCLRSRTGVANLFHKWAKILIKKVKGAKSLIKTPFGGQNSANSA